MARASHTLSAYLRHRIEGWLREDNARSAAELARAWNTSVGALEREANEWAGQQAQQIEAPTPRTDLLPSRARATAAAQLLGLSGAAVRDVQAYPPRGRGDWTPLEWLDEIRSAERRLRHPASTPGADADAPAATAPHPTKG